MILAIQYSKGERVTDADKTTYLMLTALCNNHDGNHFNYKNRQHLAQLLGLSDSAVKDRLARLRKIGWAGSGQYRWELTPIQEILSFSTTTATHVRFAAVPQQVEAVQAADVATDKPTLKKELREQPATEEVEGAPRTQALPVSTLEVFVADTEPAPVEQMVEVSNPASVPEQRAIDEDSLDPEYLDYVRRAEAAGCHVSHYLSWKDGKEHLMANIQKVEAKVRANITAQKTATTGSTKGNVSNPPLISSFEAYERKRQEEIAQWAAGDWDDQAASIDDDDVF